MKALLFYIYDKCTKNITKWRKLFKRTKDLDADMLRAYQLFMLQQTFNTNTYKEFYNTPLTTKQDLRNFKPNLKGYKKSELTTHSSSGSTGEPLVTYGPEYLQSIKPAIFERAWKSVGWDGKRWILRLTAGDPKWKVFDWLRNLKPMNYRTVNEGHYNWIIKHKPFLIHGGTGAIREITTGLIKMGRQDILKDITLYLMSEDTREHTEELKKYYKAVYSGYGLAELCTVASQCKYGNYHVNMETCIAESIKGEIVITDLYNNITPILRYRTKDYGKIRKSDCPCGSKHDILYDLVGRGVGYYDGPLTKKPLGWWIVSPISHKYGNKIKQWKVKVNLKKNQYIIYVVWKNKPTSMANYGKWIKKESGLDLVVVTLKKMSNKWRMNLLEIK